MPWPPLAPPGTTPPPPTPAEMELLVSRVGLTLNPGQMADLVLAWRQLAGLIAGIPRGAEFSDDQAFVFRLPGPAAAAPRKAAVKSKPPVKTPVRTPAKPARKR